MKITFLILSLFIVSSLQEAYDPKLSQELWRASSAAYLEKDKLKKMDCGAACSDLKGYHFNHQFTSPISKDESVSYTVFYNKEEKKAIFAFRGTAGGKQLTKEILDGGAKTYDTHKVPNALATDYFYKGYNNHLRDDVLKQTKQVKAQCPDCNFYFTGHSLGGALTSLGALDVSMSKIVDKKKLNLYTYGSPRVGDVNLAQAISNHVHTNYRVVHDKDTVPHVPPCINGFNGECLPWKNHINENGLPIWNAYHTGTEVFYSDPKNPYKYKICKRPEDPTCSKKYALIHTSIDHHDKYLGLGTDVHSKLPHHHGTHGHQSHGNHQHHTNHSQIHHPSHGLHHGNHGAHHPNRSHLSHGTHRPHHQNHSSLHFGPHGFHHTNRSQIHHPSHGSHGSHGSHHANHSHIHHPVHHPSHGVHHNHSKIPTHPGHHTASHPGHHTISHPGHHNHSHVIHKPTTGVHHPSTGVHHPTTGVHHPTVHHPSTHHNTSHVIHKPTSGVHHPTTGAHHPSTPVHHPTVHHPSTPVHKPTTGTHHPATGGSHPTPHHPVQHKPSPAHHTPAPVHHNPAPVHHTPVQHKPAPVHHTPVQHKPAPVHHTPAPVHHTPAPVHKPAPVHHAPAPVHHAPAPVHHPQPPKPTPKPAPAPVHRPIHKTH